MAQKVLEQFQCPICIDTLKSPIRMLPCGHNLCETCLVELLDGKQQRRCPFCREDFELGSEGIVGLPRNYAIENAIEEISADESQKSKSRPKTSQPHKRLKSLAESLIGEENYQNALEILTALIDQIQGVRKVPWMVEKIKCLLNLEKVEDAKMDCIECSSIIESCDGAAGMKETCDGCDEEIEKLARTFLEKKECDVGIGLANSLFKLIKCLRQGKDKLIKLEELGVLFRDIVVEMSNQNRAAEFKPQLETMNEILKEMQNIRDVDVKTKCLKVTWFMTHFGFACDETKEYSRSIEIHNQAIHSMLLVFGEEACKYQVLGYCYHNIGVAYDGTNQLSDAKASYIKSIHVKASATDYASEDATNESILFTTRQLNRVSNKMKGS